MRQGRGGATPGIGVVAMLANKVGWGGDYDHENNCGGGYWVGVRWLDGSWVNGLGWGS
jgi:hypothetical protein